MNVTSVGRYKLGFNSTSFTIECPFGTPKFSGLATSNLPKLYAICVDDYSYPIYIGMTKQPIRNRLRLGWSANGNNGYHGYAWRKYFTTATLDLWCHTDPSAGNGSVDIETVEAELVYLIRQAGQWPLFQTEIHFHRSSEVHRNVAAGIGAHYGLNTKIEQIG
ncbi:hypothetical protein M2399_003811 [Pseudomonas sp. BIGb0450]|uniref:hypothetical protein n=1 Tax=unclassified Pseudomonas TaxID=196821 RepID=UPI00216A138E|nr:MULTISPECIES: hypothetical protein [unclassified Pseudomonas]MCS3418636.1 hypothetical protein [Pseudomonas sp. BIGb0558]MCS3438356.1 hypothetical protein [Pseudomonas sp. BIGb0450]